MTGAELIAAERRRQIDDEGWTPDHDDHHQDGELLAAALVYADRSDPPLVEWPWGEPPAGLGDDRIRDLTKAGALIAAELDRLLRASGQDTDPSGRIPAAEGRRIVEAADMHPRRNLVYALAEVTSDLDGENGTGGGMWWHLQRALAVVDAMPDLRADRL